MLKKAAEEKVRGGVSAGVSELVMRPGAWLSLGRSTGVVISSRVRLARNVRERVFPGWAGEEERVHLCAEMRAALTGLATVRDPLYFDMGHLDAVDKEILKERHLISNELAERGAGSGLVLSADERIAVMINEEDHLRLQAMAPGLYLQRIWRALDAVDSELENRIAYAFSHRLGYLSACPSNLGTGLRASVMVHLPALKLLDEIGAVLNGLEKIGFTVRGLLGEGTEANGNLFQVSNQSSLGETEEAIVDRLAAVVGEVERHERHARARLLENRRLFLLDQIGRALGLLRHARILTSREAIELLSAVRLGIELNLVEHLSVGLVNEMLLLTQPGHLQQVSRKALTPEERDELRAQIMSERLQEGRLKA
jgi:protein arginine kinase